MKKRMMKKSAVYSVLFGLMASPVALSAAEYTGNIGATSDYLWRGVSQNNDSPAVFGGLDVVSDYGVYAGTWLSNVDFSNDSPVAPGNPGDPAVLADPGDTEATYELDLYFGYNGEFRDWAYDAGYIYYAYPNAADGASGTKDFGELYLSTAWRGIGLFVAYGLHEEGDSRFYQDSIYYEANTDFEVANDLYLGFAVGKYNFSRGARVNNDAENYVNYNLSLTKVTDIGDVTFMVSDTDISGDDAIVLASWNYAFDL